MSTPKTIAARTGELFRQQQRSIAEHTSRIFFWLMILQWLASIGVALWLSPRTWAGSQSQVHFHVWLALFFGGAITSVPVLLARTQPARGLTRHVIAIGQMLMSALLIHLTGGRIETHFHVFGSLAILAFYRDIPVLISATVVVFVDHLVRGLFWPESVYGVLSAPVWRSLEHAGWVIFEVTFLAISIRKSLEEMRIVAERQAKLEAVNEQIEHTVAERTDALSREVAERRQTEQQLLASRADLAQAQQIARIGRWEWDLVRDKVTLSQEAGYLYGRDPKELESSAEDLRKRIHPEDLETVNRITVDSLRSHQPFACDHRIVLPDGTERFVHARGEVLIGDTGEPIKMFGIIQDMTEIRQTEIALRRSEEQLRQSQKMEAIGRLAGGVAHDFNNLLTVITGYSSISLSAMAEDHPLRRNAIEVERAAERAATLTGQLLAFSRKQVLQPRVLNLNEVVGGMEKMLRRIIGEDIAFATIFEPHLDYIEADPGQIEQVILNMAVNARDAMPRGGKLTVRTRNFHMDQKTGFNNRTLEAGNYVLLTISDTGVGMTDEVKAHLFEPFFTTKGIGKGTGLGLATCFGIISQSGGAIHVYSEAGCGTTFKIYLPQTTAKPESNGQGDSRQLPSGTESVLVVEDDASVRTLTTLVLRERGYCVHEANGAAEALDLLRRNNPFDLIITDVIMPEMSGKSLSDQIKMRQPDAKVLFMSGYTDDALAHHGVLDEQFSFLEKPFSPSRLALKVRAVLEGTDHTPRRSPEFETAAKS